MSTYDSDLPVAAMVKNFKKIGEDVFVVVDKVAKRRGAGRQRLCRTHFRPACVCRDDYTQSRCTGR